MTPQTAKPGRRAVFFDRDGIVNRSPGPGYVERVADFHLQPEFVAALRVVRAAGYCAFLFTNQRGIALGRMAAAAVEAIHAELGRLLAREGLALDGIYVCPHQNGECACRKPLPGLLLAAARDHDVDLAASWVVGDHLRDVQAGGAAGCGTVLVGAPPPTPPEADFHLAHLADLPGLLAARLPPLQLPQPGKGN
ncbi:MAG: HAD-IIIA family hydrolase [Candidatus Marinimicrobia bacterium]|nr:HAD-IIIA family hydrolase [Candidatus Neomarinimicrobiota bacterium]